MKTANALRDKRHASPAEHIELAAAAGAFSKYDNQTKLDPDHVVPCACFSSAALRLALRNNAVM
jgi:hypothetical protein